VYEAYVTFRSGTRLFVYRGSDERERERERERVVTSRSRVTYDALRLDRLFPSEQSEYEETEERVGVRYRRPYSVKAKYGVSLSLSDRLYNLTRRAFPVQSSSSARARARDFLKPARA